MCGSCNGARLALEQEGYTEEEFIELGYLLPKVRNTKDFFRAELEKLRKRKIT